MFFSIINDCQFKSSCIYEFRRGIVVSRILQVFAKLAGLYTVGKQLLYKLESKPKNAINLYPCISSA